MPTYNFDIIVIGGGPAGLEITGNVWRLVQDQGGHAHITLVPGKELLKGFPRHLQAIARQSLQRRGIMVRDGSYAERINRDHVILSGAEALPSDIVLVATGVRPATLF